jgi:hypothetical protein
MPSWGFEPAIPAVSQLQTYRPHAYRVWHKCIYIYVCLKFTPEKATKVQRGSRGVVQLFRILNVRWKWAVNVTPRSLYSREILGTHCMGAGWAPGPVWNVAEKLTPTWILSPDRPTHSELLYWSTTCVFVCVCVCVYKYTHTHTHTYIYIYIH